MLCLENNDSICWKVFVFVWFCFESVYFWGEISPRGMQCGGSGDGDRDGHGPQRGVSSQKIGLRHRHSNPNPPDRSDNTVQTRPEDGEWIFPGSRPSSPRMNSNLSSCFICRCVEDVHASCPRCQRWTVGTGILWSRSHEY